MNKNTYKSVKLAKGEVKVYDFGSARLHAYQTHDLIDDEVFIIEKNGHAVVIGAIGTGLGLAGAIRFTILSAQGEEEQTRECFSGTTLLILLAGVLLTALLFLAYVRITTAYFYAAEKTALSYLLVYAEPVCTLLLLLALPPVLGLNGVWLAVPLAQTVTFVIALIAKRRVDRAV